MSFYKRCLRRLPVLILICILAGALWKALSLEPAAVIRSSSDIIRLDTDSAENLNQSGGRIDYRIEDPSIQVLAIESFYNPVQVFLDGEEIYTYEDSRREKGMIIQWLNMPEDSLGCVLTVVWQNTVSEGVAPGVFLGARNSMFLFYLSENPFTVLMGGFFLVAGLLFCLTSVTMYRRNRSGILKTYVHFGLFLLTAAVWLFTDTRILQFLTGYTGVIVVASFLSFLSADALLFSSVFAGCSGHRDESAFISVRPASD